MYSKSVEVELHASKKNYWEKRLLILEEAKSRVTEKYLGSRERRERLTL